MEIYRTNMSYARWWEARTFVQQMTSKWTDVGVWYGTLCSKPSALKPWFGNVVGSEDLLKWVQALTDTNPLMPQLGRSISWDASGYTPGEKGYEESVKFRQQIMHLVSLMYAVGLASLRKVCRH